MQHLTKLESMVGEVVASVQGFFGGEKVCITFQSGNHIVLQAVVPVYDDAPEIIVHPYALSMADKRALGFITQAEYVDYQTSQRAHSEKLRKESQIRLAREIFEKYNLDPPTQK